jgi:hypothetical protein
MLKKQTNKEKEPVESGMDSRGMKESVTRDNGAAKAYAIQKRDRDGQRKKHVVVAQSARQTPLSPKLFCIPIQLYVDGDLEVRRYTPRRGNHSEYQIDVAGVNGTTHATQGAVTGDPCHHAEVSQRVSKVLAKDGESGGSQKNCSGKCEDQRRRR